MKFSAQKTEKTRDLKKNQYPKNGKNSQKTDRCEIIFRAILKIGMDVCPPHAQTGEF